MFCKNCGQNMEKGTAFCKNCGTPMVKPAQVHHHFIAWCKQYKVLLIILAVAAIFIFVVIAAGSSSPTDSSSTSQTVSTQTSLPTVPSQLQNDDEDSATPSPSQQENTSPSVGTENSALITADDIAPYLTAVGLVECSKGGVPQDTGSGSVWKFSDSQLTYVLTNEHVIQGNDSCTILISPTPSDSTEGYYDLDVSSPMEWNDNTDAAAIPMTGIDALWATSTPISQLNDSVAYLRDCPTSMPQESPVVVIGYPASTESAETVTNGDISGYDSSNPDEYNDYFVSSQVDSGNSGGIALSKDSNGLCLLGVPTWVSVGNYQNEGVVQDINNIFYFDTTSGSSN